MAARALFPKVDTAYFASPGSLQRGVPEEYLTVPRRLKDARVWDTTDTVGGQIQVCGPAVQRHCAFHLQDSMMFPSPREVGTIAFRQAHQQHLSSSQPFIRPLLSLRCLSLARRKPYSSTRSQHHAHNKMIALTRTASVSMLALVSITLAMPVENEAIPSIILPPTTTTPSAYAKYDPAMQTVTMPADATASIFCYDDCRNNPITI